ncbi:hypothetical protein [Bdellovibrio sp. BCCA]|uniref:hypothetical protein n=1 Tax=Bdellovibrio sp. BCCA TaxID=3136281 RepID=UPI0030F2A8FF
MKINPKFTILFFVLANIGCQSLTKSVDQIKNNAPPAMIQILEAPDKQGIVFGDPSSFEFIIRQGLFNKLTVRVSGIELEHVTDIPKRSTELVDQKRMFYTTADVGSDTKTKTWDRVISIHNPYKMASPHTPSAIVIDLSFTEESINPQYDNEPNSKRKSISHLMVRAGKPQVFLTVPERVNRHPEDTTKIDVPVSWRVSGANNVKVYRGSKMIRNQGVGGKEFKNAEYVGNIIDQRSGVHLGSGSIEYKIVASLDAYQKTEIKKAKFSASTELQTEVTSPCPEGQWPQYFILCRRCYDSKGQLMFTPGERFQPACSLDQAKEEAKRGDVSCTYEEVTASSPCR